MMQSYKNFFKSLVLILAVLIVFSACNLSGEKTDTGGGSASLAVVPSALVVSVPDITNQTATRAITRASGGILDPDSITQLLTPLFTGLKPGDTAGMEFVEEADGSLTSTDWIGFYKGRPVLINVTSSATGMTMKYYQDIAPLKDKTEDDIRIANVEITYAQQNGAIVTSFGSWELNQSMSNPFDSSENYVLTASGDYGPTTFTGAGTFTATSGSYTGSATVSWTQNSSGKYINIKKGTVTYTGEAARDYFNVTGLNMTIYVDPETGDGTITENATIVTVDTSGNETTVTRSVTTKNDDKGNPTDVAFTVTGVVKDASGKITDSYTRNGSKKLTVDASSGSMNVTVGEDSDITIDDTYVDDDATSGILTVSAKNLPMDTKKAYVYVYKMADILWIEDESGMSYAQPAEGSTFVDKKFVDTIGKTTASLATASLDPGKYFIFIGADIMGNTTLEDMENSFNDDFTIQIPGFLVDGATDLVIGTDDSGYPWFRLSDDGNYDTGKDSVMASINARDVNDEDISGQFAGGELYVKIVPYNMDGKPDLSWSIYDGMKPLGTSPADPLELELWHIDFAYDLTSLNELTVVAFIDMNFNGIVDAQTDYYFGQGASITYDGMKITIDGSAWGLAQDGDKYKGSNWDIFAPYDGKVPSGSGDMFLDSHADPNNPNAISGVIESTVYQEAPADLWMAVLSAGDPDNPDMEPQPVAFCMVNDDGSFSFSGFKKDINGNPIVYWVLAFGYRYFNPGEPIRMPYPDDFAALAAPTDGQFKPNPVGMMWDSALGDYAGITYDSMGMPSSTASKADFNLGSWLLWDEFMTQSDNGGETGSSANINLVVKHNDSTVLENADGTYSQVAYSGVEFKLYTEINGNWVGINSGYGPSFVMWDQATNQDILQQEVYWDFWNMPDQVNYKIVAYQKVYNSYEDTATGTWIEETNYYYAEIQKYFDTAADGYTDYSINLNLSELTGLDTIQADVKLIADLNLTDFPNAEGKKIGYEIWSYTNYEGSVLSNMIWNDADYTTTFNGTDSFSNGYSVSSNLSGGLYYGNFYIDMNDDGILNQGDLNCYINDFIITNSEPLNIMTPRFNWFWY